MGILAVMFALAIVGNSRVMWVLRQKWSSRGRMTVMSFNVALADTLVALITILGEWGSGPGVWGPLGFFGVQCLGFGI